MLTCNIHGDTYTYLMESKQRLEELFSHFPGIGPRQARRFVYYLLAKSPSSIRELVQLIEEVKKSSKECEKCHRYFSSSSGNSISGTSSSHRAALQCSICSDPNRDQSTLMIVARDFDLESVEKSGAYKGLYFVIGGTVPILDKEPERRIRLKSLLERVSTSSEIKEIILSLNTTPEGGHTEVIVKDAISRVVGGRTVKISILGRGLSTGAELEYADEETIRSALGNRH